jgi:hypothetical protein
VKDAQAYSPAMSSLAGRLAIALGVLFVVAAAVVTFAPASPSGATCGNWISPEWSDAKTQELVDQASSTYDQATALGSDEIASESAGLAISARRAHDVCADSLSTRRTVAIVLLALGLVVPIAVMFVVSGGRRNGAPPTPSTA